MTIQQQQPKRTDMEKKSIYIVTRNGQLIPELIAKTEREAWGHLGRWLVPIDIVLEGGTLVDLGRQAANGVNPFRVQRADISW